MHNSSPRWFWLLLFVLCWVGSRPAHGQITEIFSTALSDSSFDAPFGLALDGSGNVFVGTFNTDNVFQITPGGVITEILDELGDGAGHVFDRAFSLAVDASGNVYVAGQFSDNVMRIAAPGTCSTGTTPCTITEIIDATGDGGGNTLDTPLGVAVDGSGNVYVGGGGSHNVFRITPGGTITEIIDATGDGSNALTQPNGIAVDGSGNIYVAGASSDNVFRITPGGTITEIIDAAGDGSNTFDSPRSVALDGSGNVFVTGLLTHNVFKIATPGTCNTGGGTPCTITEIIDASGDGSNALTQPNGIAVDGSGNVYVGGGGSDNVFRIDTPGTCSTGGTPCTFTEIIDASGDGSSIFDQPGLIAVNSAGTNVYVTGTASDNAFEIVQAIPTLSIDDVTQAEGNSGTTTFQFTVTLTNDAAGAFTVDFTTNDATAEDENGDGDYQSNSGQLSFAGTAGETQTVDVTVNGEVTVELDETFTVDLSNISGGGVTFADAQGQGTLTNDDAATLSIDDVTQAEGNSGTSTFQFTVTLDSAVDTGVSVDIDTSDDTATTADNDYVANTGSSLNFSGMAGETETFDVTVNGDATVELDEIFFVHLSNIVAGGRAVTFSDAQGQGTLTNDDAATLSIDDMTQAEGNSGTSTFQFTVTLDSAVDTGLTVDFATTDGTAEDENGDGDYQSNSGTLNFNGTDDETQTVDVTVNGDMTIEPDETFTVDLSTIAAGGRAVTFADDQGLGIITSDDDDVDLAVTTTESVDPVEAGSGAGNLTYIVTVTNNGPGTATGVELEETLTLPPGVTIDSVTPSVGTFATPTWTVGMLNAGADATLIIVLTVGASTAPGVDVIASTAIVTAVNETDTDPSNDSSTEATSVDVEADVRLAKSADTLSPDFGATVVFTLTVTNDGPSGAVGIQVTDLLPDGLTYVSDDGGGAYNPATGTWLLGMLSMGASDSLKIAARVDTIEPVTNTAAITKTQSPDPNPANNSADVTVTPMAADLAVAKRVVDYAADPGEGAAPDSVAATFLVTVTNHGPSTATGVVVSDPLPEEGLLVSASASQGGYDASSGIWTVGTMAVGASATLTVTVKAEAGNNLINIATASADQPDQHADNNLAGAAGSHDHQGVAHLIADLSVAKRVDNETPSVGDLIIYTISVANGGPSTTAGVVIGERLPDGLTFVSAVTTSDAATCRECGYDEAEGVWRVGHLPVGREAVLAITVRVDAPGEIINRAEVLESHLPDLDSILGGRSDTDDPEDDEGTARIVASAGADARVPGRAGQDGASAGEAPLQVELGSSYPNPFNPETSIPFGLPQAAHVRLAVYNVLGQQVALLVDGEREAGRHKVVWQAVGVPTGLYLVRLVAGSVQKVQRITLVK